MSKSVHRWRGVESLVLRLISEGGVAETGVLPGDKEIAKLAGTSLQPVRRAMDELARKGIILRQQGARTRVLNRPPLIDDHEMSFRHSATKAYGVELTNQLVELKRRLPQLIDSAPDERGSSERWACGATSPST